MSNVLLDRYRQGGFRHVEGWGIDEELFELFVLCDDFQKAHNIKGPLVEIGVHHGRTLILLGLLRHPEDAVVGIDLFEVEQDQNLDASGRGSRAMLERNLEQHAPGVPFTLIASNSMALSLAKREELAGARFFHIDGGHFTEVVLNDLALAQQVLGSGGIIVIDDYWHSGFPEVQEAVHRYFWTSTAIRAVPFLIGKNKIFLSHLSHKDRLLRFMEDRLAPQHRKPVRVLSHAALCFDPH